MRATDLSGREEQLTQKERATRLPNEPLPPRPRPARLWRTAVRQVRVTIDAPTRGSEQLDCNGYAVSSPGASPTRQANIQETWSVLRPGLPAGASPRPSDLAASVGVQRP